MNKESLNIVLGYVLICLLWGSTWLAIRVGVADLNPIFAAGLRFLLASFFFFLLMKIRRIKLQTDSFAMKFYMFMGFFSFVIPFGLVYWAEQYIPSGLTSVIFAVFPFVVIIFSYLMIPDETIGVFKIAGTLLGFAGIYIIFSSEISMDISEDIWAMSAILLSAAIQAYVVVVVKKKGSGLHPLSMNLIPVLIAGVSMVILALLFEDTSRIQFTYEAVASVVYLGFFGTVLTFTTYYWLIKKINVVIVSLSAFITPIIAILLGWIILDEKFSGNDLLGAALVLFGILVANTRGLAKYYKSKQVMS
ncbi:MAG: EamA family transporter [Melioribacteraceae bacterium]|nr:EamA family transporter [Melioribacteraceae bacterium]